MMKAKIFTQGIMLASLLLVGACDYIDKDDRFIYVEPANVAKRVLIEDFTGQRCVNCPSATETIKQLQDTYGKENVIAVAIHSGPFSKTLTGTPYPLYTETGDYYYNLWGVQEQPSAMIDRHGVTSNYMTWGTSVYKAIQESASLLLNASCSYDAETSTASISIDAEGVDAVDGKLQVWLTEDSVTSLQFMEGNVIDQNYVHNHVFRKSVNDVMGDAVSIGEGEKKTLTYTTEIDSKWNVENMSVIVFVYNGNGVLQAAEAKVTGSEVE